MPVFSKSVGVFFLFFFLKRDIRRRENGLTTCSSPGTAVRAPEAGDKTNCPYFSTIDFATHSTSPPLDSSNWPECIANRYLLSSSTLGWSNTTLMVSGRPCRLISLSSRLLILLACNESRPISKKSASEFIEFRLSSTGPVFAFSSFSTALETRSNTLA